MLKSKIWIFIAAAVVFASALKKWAVLPGLLLLIFLSYALIIISQELLKNKKIPLKPAIIALITAGFLWGTNQGKSFLSETMKPFVIAKLERQFAKNPHDTQTAHYLSTIYAIEGNYIKAMPILNNLIETNPCDLISLHNRSLLNLTIKKYRECLNDRIKAIDCDNDNALLWLQLGETYQVNQMPDSADIAWKKALGLTDNDKELHEKILKKLNRKNQ